MRKFTTLVVCLLLPIAAFAQTASTQPPAPGMTTETPVKSELEKVFNELSGHLKQIDKLAADLKATTTKKPSDTQSQLEGAAATLSALADRLQPSGDLAAQLSALRNAAALHRQRIQDTPKEAIEESDRSTLLNTWDKALQDTDKAGAAIADMKDRLVQVLGKLRKRQAAVGEYLLAGQYQAAVSALRAWVGELESTVKSLHAAIDPAKPAA